MADTYDYTLDHTYWSMRTLPGDRFQVCRFRAGKPEEAVEWVKGDPWEQAGSAATAVARRAYRQGLEDALSILSKTLEDMGPDWPTALA